MKLNFLAEQQKQSREASSFVGDKDTSKSKIDAAHNFMERDGDSKASTVDPLAVITDGQESKPSQQCMETLFVSESQTCEVDESIRTLYAIVSSPDTESKSMLRHPALLSDNDSQS